MKKIAIFFLIITISIAVSAQISNGLFILEGGFDPVGNSSIIGISGVSFKSTSYCSKTYNGRTTYSCRTQNNFNYTISPKMAYTIFNNFAAGIDFQYKKHIFSRKNNSHGTDRNRSILYGVFLRQYFGKGKFLPLIEAGLGIGSSKSNEDSTSPGGVLYQVIEQRNLFYLSGAAGVSYAFNSKFRINLLAKGQQTTEKPIHTENYHPAYSKITELNTTIVFSFSYFLNRKQIKDIKNSK